MKLSKNSINTACFRLNSKSEITGDTRYFLFQFTNHQTKQEILFTGEDISVNKPLFNEFQFTETGSTYTNLTASTINLEPSGWWSYKVYEMTDPTNLFISGTTGQPIEYGKVEVLDATNNPSGGQYTYTGDTTTRYVYNPID